MTTKATDSVLNLVSPPISNMVLSQGTLDNVVIGQTTPNTGKFTTITDTGIASPLVGAPSGLLIGIGLGSGLVMTGNVLTLTAKPLPPSGLTLFIRSDGNDSHDGSVNDGAHAFATIQGALTYVNNNFFLAGNRPLILYLGQAGTYAAPLGLYPTGSTIFLGGFGGTPSDFVISGGLAQDVFIVSGSTLSVSNCTVTNLGAVQNWFSSESGGLIIVNNVIIACAVINNPFAVFNSFPGGSMDVESITVECDAGAVFYAHGGGNINISGNNASTITFLGGPNFTIATAIAFDLGFIVSGLAVMSGVVSGQRFNAFNNGVINVEGQGANFFPGTIAGTTATGGIYQT